MDFEKKAKIDLGQKTEYFKKHLKVEDIKDDYQMLAQELMPEYCEGYLKAIFELMPKVKNDHTIFFPLTFLLSHYMELWIKTLGLYYGLDFSFDMKGLGLTGHSIRKLILDKQQLSEFSNRGISVEEIEKVLKLWEYFEEFAKNGTELSIAMRYPIMLNDNVATIKDYKNYKALDVDKYIDMGNQIIEKTAIISLKFFESELSELMEQNKRLRQLKNLSKRKENEVVADNTEMGYKTRRQKT